MFALCYVAIFFPALLFAPLACPQPLNIVWFIFLQPFPNKDAAEEGNYRSASAGKGSPDCQPTSEPEEGQKPFGQLLISARERPWPGSGEGEHEGFTLDTLQQS
jgi:hypothetical protein